MLKAKEVISSRAQPSHHMRFPWPEPLLPHHSSVLPCYRLEMATETKFFPLSDAKTDEFRHCGCALRHSCCVARDNDNDKSRYLLKCLQACDRVLSLHQSVQSLCCNIMIDIYFKSEYSPQNVFRRFRTHTALGPPDAWEGWAGSDWTPANGDWDRG